MIYAIKQYNCTIKTLALMKYCKEFKDPKAGFPSGLVDTGSKVLMVSGTKAVLQRESAEALRSTWLIKFSLSEKNLNLIRLADLHSLELGQRQFTGNWKEDGSITFLLFPLSPEYSFVMARRGKQSTK